MDACLLDGIWRKSRDNSADEQFYVIESGYFNGEVIKEQDGVFMVNGWNCKVFSKLVPPDQIMWETPTGKKVFWQSCRFMNGTWAAYSSEDEVMELNTVVKGRLGDLILELHDGSLTLGGYKAVCIHCGWREHVKWESADGKVIYWRRWLPEDLDGIWKCIQTKHMFVAKKGLVAGCDIEVKDGFLNVRGGLAKGELVTMADIRWTVWTGGEWTEGSRWISWNPRVMDGIWQSPSGNFEIIDESCIFEVQDGSDSLSCMDAILSVNDRDDELHISIDDGGLLWRRRDLLEDNVKVLYHATSEFYAKAICVEKRFVPGSSGYLGPGIYFSETRGDALQYYQAHKMRGGPKVLQVEVDLGKVCERDDVVNDRSRSRIRDLLDQECDSFKRLGKDCYMLPNNNRRQINMNTLQVVTM